MNYIKFSFIFLFLVSCAQHLEVLDAAVVDGAEPACLPPPNANIEFCACGNYRQPCSPMYADNCVSGNCVCGDNTTACSSGTNCKFGKCVEPDLEGSVCEFDDECYAGFYCVVGHCTFYNCVPEECDGYDNDCNGQIDEAPGGRGPLSEWCFGDNPAPENVRPPCNKGVRTCIDGWWGECENDITPTAEQGWLACDGLDNNCDGCIDGELVEDGICIITDPVAYDILFIIDTSGSMEMTISMVTSAVDGFSSNFAGSDMFKFALITFPDTVSGYSYTIRTDFVLLPEFQVFLAQVVDDAGSNEPNWDVVYEVATNEASLSWRQSSVRIIAEFTDEKGQSYRIPQITEQNMCDSLTHGEVVAFFTNLYNRDDFNNCGQQFEITDKVTMRMNLEGIIVNPCS